MSDGIGNLANTMGTESTSLTTTQQTQALTPDAGPSYFMFGNYGYKIVNTQLLIESQLLGNAFILGSTTNAILGISTLGSINMVWKNSGSIWGTVNWGGTLPAFSTIYSNTISQRITELGKNAIAGWFGGNSVIHPNYAALGTDDTPYNSTQTALVSESYRALFDTYDRSTDYVLNSQWNINSIQVALQGITFKEIGSFNDVTTGTMFSRYTFPSMEIYNTHNYRFTIQSTIIDTSSYGSISTTSGINAMRDWLGGQTITPPQYVAWGDGTTVLDISDTTLEGELQRNSIDSFSYTNDTAFVEALLSYSQGVNSRISKSGLFDTSTLGTLWFEQINNAGPLKYDTFQIDEIDQIIIS
jgi:hypothetical protein